MPSHACCHNNPTYWLLDDSLESHAGRRRGRGSRSAGNRVRRREPASAWYVSHSHFLLINLPIHIAVAIIYCTTKDANNHEFVVGITSPHFFHFSAFSGPLAVTELNGSDPPLSNRPFIAFIILCFSHFVMPFSNSP